MANLYVSKVTKAGQVSVPKELRALMGLREAEYVSMEPSASGILVRKIEPAKSVFERFDAKAGGKKASPKAVQNAIEKVRASLMSEKYGI